jgi:hypothetical protein
MQKQKQSDRCKTERDELNHPEGTMFTLFESKSGIAEE